MNATIDDIAESTQNDGFEVEVEDLGDARQKIKGHAGFFSLDGFGGWFF